MAWQKCSGIRRSYLVFTIAGSVEFICRADMTNHSCKYFAKLNVEAIIDKYHIINKMRLIVY